MAPNLYTLCLLLICRAERVAPTMSEFRAGVLTIEGNLGSFAPSG